jgi:tetratricopeptide (TPR) repeat protein
LTARHAASESGDQYLADIALAEHVYLPTYSDDPQGVLSLAEARLAKNSPDTPAISWLWAYCGKAHAALGDASKAQRAFDRSQIALDNSAPGSLTTGIFSFLPEKLQMYRAQAFVSLNQPEPAVAAAEQALSLYSSDETTEPSLARFARASALLQAGDVDEACRCAIEAVTGSNVYINVAIKQRAKSFTDEIPESRSSAVREWRDVLLTASV